MNKRQAKKHELSNKLAGNSARINGLEHRVAANKTSIANLVEAQSHLFLEVNAQYTELRDELVKLKETNCILVEQDEIKSKRIRGLYVLVSILFVIGVLQWVM